MPDSLENKTLREKLSSAEVLSRELIHHLESGFIPKTLVLKRTARLANEPGDSEDITDMTIRDTVDRVVKGDDFTQSVSQQLRPVLASIHSDVERILGRENLK